jgi:agmatinase
MQAEADLPEAGWDEERRWALRMGLTGAESIEDKSIPTFARGELPITPGSTPF